MQGFRHFLQEMPIGKFNLVGDWGEDDPRRYWDKKSIGILTSEKAVRKIKRQWNNTKQTFDMHFVRLPKLWKQSELGEVDAEWVKENIVDEKGDEIQVNPDNVTIIYVSNIGDQKVPMSGWVLGHRLGHAIKNTQDFQHFQHELHRFMSDVLKDIYNYRVGWTHSRGDFPSIMPGSQQGSNYGGSGPNANEILTAFAHSLGTMRSARQQNISRIYEFGYELIGQQIISGEITFNPDLADQLTQKGSWGRQSTLARSNIQGKEVDKKEMSEYLQSTADALTYYADDLLNSLEGRIFVM